jgi:hypothetical protein
MPLRNLSEGVHLWLLRPWTGFNIAANSACGLLLSIIFGTWVLKIEPTTWWFAPVIGFGAFLAIVAFIAWNDSMRMAEFMVDLELAPDAKRKQ